jgi:hypothetical protein
MAQPLTITLSPELAEKVRDRAAVEGYSDESAFVEDHLAEAVTEDSELENWLKTVGVARYDAYDANPKDVFAEEEVLGHVRHRLNSLRKAG